MLKFLFRGVKGGKGLSKSRDPKSRSTHGVRTRVDMVALDKLDLDLQLEEAPIAWVNKSFVGKTRDVD